MSKSNNDKRQEHEKKNPFKINLCRFPCHDSHLTPSFPLHFDKHDPYKRMYLYICIQSIVTSIRITPVQTNPSPPPQPPKGNPLPAACMSSSLNPKKKNTHKEPIHHMVIKFIKKKPPAQKRQISLSPLPPPNPRIRPRPLRPCPRARRTSITTSSTSSSDSSTTPGRSSQHADELPRARRRATDEREARGGRGRDVEVELEGGVGGRALQGDRHCFVFRFGSIVMLCMCVCEIGFFFAFWFGLVGFVGY